MWRHRQRALSFGADARRYDRARPGYPAGLVSDLMRDAPRRVLDVGCGTGKAGLQFAARGCQVVGVEPDPGMAAVAAEQDDRGGSPPPVGGDLTVEVATFEEWDPRGRTFDLVISGQAWHWVDPQAGPRKVLVDGGRLAAFWNRASYDDAVRADLDAIYERVAPSISTVSVVRGAVPDAQLGHDLGIDGHRDFAPGASRIYHWDLNYTRAQYLDLLQTHSDHLMLPADVLEELLTEIGALIDRLGGHLAVRYRTTLRTAVRVPRDRS
jgi:SAM-dependent methyltransferase